MDIQNISKTHWRIEVDQLEDIWNGVKDLMIINFHKLREEI